MDYEGKLGNNKIFFIPSDDLYLLCVLNSPLLWWHNTRYLPHMKDEALTPLGYLMEKLPIAEPSDPLRTSAESAATRLIEIVRSNSTTRNDLLDWLKVEHLIVEPSQKLQSSLELDSESFVAEVRKARGKKNPLSLAALRNLREEHTRTILPAQALAKEALALERKISDLVNEAYGLTPEEIELMWETAPPRHADPATLRPKEILDVATKKRNDKFLHMNTINDRLGFGEKAPAMRLTPSLRKGIINYKFLNRSPSPHVPYIFRK